MTRTAPLVFALGLASLISRPCHAAEPLVVDAPLPEGARPVDVRFSAEPRLGAAWVEIEYAMDDDPFGELRLGIARVPVPGLSYDRAVRAVRLEVPGDSLVCARRGRVLLGTVYRETGACRLRLGEPTSAVAGRLVIDVPARQNAIASGGR